MPMRTINKNPRNKKNTAIWWVIAAIVLIGGFCFWFFVINGGFSTGVEKNKPEQQASDTKDKQEFIEGTAEEPTGENPLSSGNTDESKVAVTTAVNDEYVVVSTKLYEYSDGMCTLKVTNGSKQDTQSAPIIFQAEYSTCAGFSVKRDDLGSGVWAIELTATSKGVSVTQKASVEVK